MVSPYFITFDVLKSTIMERRNFLKAATALCGLAITPAIFDSCSKQSNAAVVNMTIDLSNSGYSMLNTVGGSIVKDGVLVMRVNATTFSAIAAACTHEGCTVAYNPASTKVVCPCHNGIYDTNGAVISGPPPSALAKYTVTQSGTILTIKS